MKALVLVGGEGTRLRPLTYAVPKPLLPVANIPFVDRTMRRLADVGCTEIVLSSYYKSGAFDDVVANAPVPTRIVVESEPLGTGGAVGFAARGFDETFVVLNGDIMTDLDLASMIAFHRESGAEATITLTPVDDPSRFGVVDTDHSGRVRAFIEKPEPGTAPTNLINAGTYVCEPAMLDRIPTGRQVSIERETFPEMVADRVLFAKASDAYWLDFGTHATYLQANLDCLSGAIHEPVPGESRDNRIFVDPTAKVSESARLGPDVVVGPRSVIGDDARVGNGVAIGAGVEVGARASVSESVLLDGASVGEGAILHIAMVGHGGLVPAGAKLDAGTVVEPQVHG